MTADATTLLDLPLWKALLTVLAILAWSLAGSLGPKLLGAPMWSANGWPWDHLLGTASESSDSEDTLGTRPAADRPVARVAPWAWTLVLAAITGAAALWSGWPEPPTYAPMGEPHLQAQARCDHHPVPAFAWARVPRSRSDNLRVDPSTVDPVILGFLRSELARHHAVLLAVYRDHDVPTGGAGAGTTERREIVEVVGYVCTDGDVIEIDAYLFDGDVVLEEVEELVYVDSIARQFPVYAEQIRRICRSGLLEVERSVRATRQGHPGELFLEWRCTDPISLASTDGQIAVPGSPADGPTGLDRTR